MKSLNSKRLFALLGLCISLGACTWGKNQNLREVKPASDLTASGEIRDSLEISAASPSLVETQWKRSWSRKMPGTISEFSVAKKSRAVVAATQPDPDIEGSSKHFLLTQLNSKGEIHWQFKPSSPVRDLDITPDGSLVVASDYEHEVYGVVFDKDKKAKKTWKREVMCRPRVIHVDGRDDSIICYHDDDSEADTGFDIFDKAGKSATSFTLPPQKGGQDILSFKLAENLKHLVVGLSKGQVGLFKTDSVVPKWKKFIPGEIADLAVSSESSPKVAVLYLNGRKNKKHAGGVGWDSQPSQRIRIFNTKGSIISSTEPPFHVLQIEFAPKGQGLFVYGNGANGQNLAFYSLPSLKEEWRKTSTSTAVYSSLITVTSDLVIQGFEDEGVEGKGAENRNPKIQLLIFDHQGKLKSQIPIEAEETAHLYGVKVAGDGKWLVVATDDGMIQSFVRE